MTTLPEQARRSVQISDAMIMIAGLAVVMSASSHLVSLLAEMLGRLCRESVEHLPDLAVDWPRFRNATEVSLRNTLWYGFQVAESVVFGLAPVFLVLRLRRPRPDLRGLIRQPGAVAALAMVFGFFWGTGFLLAVLPGSVDGTNAAAVAVGGAVALAWVAMLLGRWWRPEAHWVDRLGRLLGGAAIATAIVGLVVFRI